MLREARAAAAIRHANVVTLFDIVSHAGDDILVMERVADATRTGAAPADAVTPACLPIAQGMTLTVTAPEPIWYGTCEPRVRATALMPHVPVDGGVQALLPVV